MALSSLTRPDVATVDAYNIAQHNATHPEELSPYGWTDAWLLGLLQVRTSPQEDEALRNFERT